MIRILPACLLGLCCQETGAQNAADQAPLLFAQAVHFALDHAPTITSARSAVSSAEAQKLAAVAAFLPTLSLSDQPEIFNPVIPSGSSVVGGVVIPNGHGYNANVASANLNLNLFAGGKDVANYHASIEALSSASLGLTATLDTTLDQLLTDFTAVCVDQITLANQERIIAIDQDLIDLTSLRVQGKMDSQIEMIQAQLQALQAKSQLSQTRQQRTTDLEKLYTDMGFPQTTRNAALREWIPEPPPVGPGDGSIEDDPYVSSARDAVLAAQEKVTAARGEYYPTVAFTFQYNYLGVDASSMRRAFDGTRANNYTVGLGVTLPLLPFINVNADIDAARATVLSAQGQYQGALVSVTNRLTDASVKLGDAQNTLDLATRAAELARRNLQLTQDKYAAHQADQRDVDTARVASAQSEQSFGIASINYRLAAWEQYRALHPKEFPATLLEAVAGPGSPAQPPTGAGERLP
jgi:outer membrane protein TolC